MRKTIFFVTVLAVIVSFSGAAFAYQATAVTNGGSIEGVVEYAGATVPKDPVLKLSSETKYCGTTLPAGRVLIKDKKVQNVVVYIDDIKSGKAVPTEALIVTNAKCAFVPHVAVAFQGGKLTLTNDDPIFHNIHTYLNSKTMFNVGLPEKGATVTKPLPRTGLMEVTCDSHPWMHGYIQILDHPYAAVSSAAGDFTIKDIPPGTYSLEAWHETLGKVKMPNVKVESGKATKVKVDFKK